MVCGLTLHTHSSSAVKRKRKSHSISPGGVCAFDMYMMSNSLFAARHARDDVETRAGVQKHAAQPCPPSPPVLIVTFLTALSAAVSSSSPVHEVSMLRTSRSASAKGLREPQRIFDPLVPSWTQSHLGGTSCSHKYLVTWWDDNHSALFLFFVTLFAHCVLYPDGLFSINDYSAHLFYIRWFLHNAWLRVTRVWSGRKFLPTADDTMVHLKIPIIVIGIWKPLTFIVLA